MLNKFKYSCLALMLFFSFTTFAQKEAKLSREGNKLYEKNNYKDAEIKYRKSINENKLFQPSYYNLANSMYNQGKYAEADSIYKLFNANTKNKDWQSNSYYNIGNSLFQQQKYAESIDAYKKSLKIKPDDIDTKYNLAQAQRMLQQQQQQQQQNKDNKDNKDNKEDKEKQNQQNQENKDENKDKKEQQQNKKQINKNEAERLLNALENNDKKIQEKIKEKNAKQQNRNNIEKDW